METRSLSPSNRSKALTKNSWSNLSFAYHCRLGGVAAFRLWTEGETEDFEGSTRDKVLSVTFTIPDSESKCPVWLVEQTDTADIVFNEEFASPRYKSRSVPDNLISVVVGCYPVVSFIDGTLDFHLCPIDDAYQLNVFANNELNK